LPKTERRKASEVEAESRASRVAVWLVGRAERGRERERGGGGKRDRGEGRDGEGGREIGRDKKEKIKAMREYCNLRRVQRCNPNEFPKPKKSKFQTLYKTW
jgi:hypothetical protein